MRYFEKKKRVEEIIEDIRGLADEALNMMPSLEQERARASWHAQILTALSSDHDYLGGIGLTLEEGSEVMEDD